jgi:hypothetical protein
VTLVRGKFAGDSLAVQTLEAAQAKPEDAVQVRRLAETLVEHGQHDASFLAALSDLVEEARRDPVIGPAVVQVNDYGSIGKVVTIGTVHGDVTF